MTPEQVYNVWRAAGHAHEDAMYAVRVMRDAAATAEPTADAGAGASSYRGSLPAPAPAQTRRGVAG